MDPEKPTAGSSSSAAGDTVSAEVDDAKRALDMASTGSSSPPKPEEKDDQTGVGLEEAAKVAESASKDHGVNLLLDGINLLVHSVPPLVKALDAVAQVHPFIASAFCLRARALSLGRVAEMVHPNSRRGIQGCD